MEVTIRIADEEKIVKVLEEIDERARDLRRPLGDFGERLVRKMQTVGQPGEIDNMALAGVLSTQILHQRFVQDSPPSLPAVKPRLLVDRRGRARRSRDAAAAKSR